MKNIYFIFVLCLMLISCNKQRNQAEIDNSIPVPDPSYVPTPPTYRICPKCKTGYDRDNIFAFPEGVNGICLSCYNKEHPENVSHVNVTSGNQYGKGYEQGKEDAINGSEYDPSGYGGNGQFEKGYEDGYNDYN